MKLLLTVTTAAIATLSTGIALAQSYGDAPSAHAVFLNNAGETVGEAHLMQGPSGTLITLELYGLPPGPKAIHIHASGTCEDHGAGFMASGGHLNPDGAQHGLMNPEGPDAGDFTNFYVHENGYAWAELFNWRASLDGSIGATILDNSGAALVIHENPDDHITQPIGGAGARIACGVITAVE